MIAKKNVFEKGYILAVCDSDIAGRVFEDQKRILDLSGDFFSGEEADEASLARLARDAYMLNLNGKESVDFGVRNGFVDEEKVIFVKDVPHAEAVLKD